MSFARKFVTISIFLNLFFSTNFVECKNLVVKKFGMCDGRDDYPSKIYASFVTKNGNQYVSGNISFSQDFGDNIMVYIKVFMTPFGSSKNMKILDTKETFCKMTRNYVGPYMNDLEKAAQILPPGVCPIPKGRYHVTDFPLAINKIFVKEIIPVGKIKFLARSVDPKTSKDVACYEADVEVS